MLRATPKSGLLCSAAAVLLLAAISLASSAADTFIVAACSKLKFAPGSPYESSLTSLLAASTTSASYASYNNLSASVAGSAAVRGLFQCRGDLSGGDCGRCVSRAAGEVVAVCPYSCGGALQLDGCFVRYGNETFVGEQDRSVLVKRCGPSIGYGPEAMSGRDEVLDYLGASGGAYFRVGGGSGGVRGVAQCVGDLSASECQDCLTDAIGRLRTECASPSWGDMFLGKCYVRYSGGEAQSRGGNGNGSGKTRDDEEETEKTLAILIGLIAGVALLIVFLSFLRKACEKGGKGGK